MVGGLVMFALVALLTPTGVMPKLVGQSLATILVVAPLAVLAYWSVVIPLFLSPDYRQRVAALLRRTSPRAWHGGLFLLYLLLNIVSLWRSAMAGTIGLQTGIEQMLVWTAAPLLMTAIVLNGQAAGASAPLLRATIAGFFAYSLANLMLFGVGFASDTAQSEYVGAQTQGLLFRMLGISMTRAPVPLGGGLSLGGALSAIAIVLAVVIVVRGGGSRILAAAAAGASIFMLLLTDVRNGVMGAVAGLAAVFLLPRVVRMRASWLAIALPVLPYVMLVLLQALGSQGWAAEINRGQPGPGAASLATGRPLIWASVLGFLSDFKLEHLFGYGALGHITSGVSAQYGAFFTKLFASPFTRSTHNTVLQSIIELGYVGAVIQLMLFWYLLRHFARRVIEHRALHDAGFGATVCLMLLGLNEITLSYGTHGTLALFMALNFHVLFTDDDSVRARAAHPAEREPVVVSR